MDLLGKALSYEAKSLLSIEMRVAPLIAHNVHGVFGNRPLLYLSRSTWKVCFERNIGCHFSPPSMHEVPNKKGITIVKGDQQSARECYSCSIRKVEPRSIKFILMDINGIDDPEQGDDEEMVDTFEEETTFEVWSTPEEGITIEEATNLD